MRGSAEGAFLGTLRILRVSGHLEDGTVSCSSREVREAIALSSFVLDVVRYSTNYSHCPHNGSRWLSVWTEWMIRGMEYRKLSINHHSNIYHLNLDKCFDFVVYCLRSTWFK
jgi:hypothetical protein